MKGGVLQVLLVSAEGLNHAHILGTSRYYVTLRYGSQVFTSKITEEKDEKVRWNEKFTFKISSTKWKELNKLRLNILERDKFNEDHSVGEATVYLRGVLMEGNLKGCLELKPAPYNVVLRDGTYKGEVKVGLKFTSNAEEDHETERMGGRSSCMSMPERQPQCNCRTILKFALMWIPRPRFLVLHSNAIRSCLRKICR